MYVVVKYTHIGCLLKLHDAGVANKRDESYMGYEIWLPRPPKVDKPRSVYNAASLAYIGDCIYEVQPSFYLLCCHLMDGFQEYIFSIVTWIM